MDFDREVRASAVAAYLNREHDGWPTCLPAFLVVFGKLPVALKIRALMVWSATVDDLWRRRSIGHGV